jgi:APA family basic amino acid/polyamine antiporter
VGLAFGGWALWGSGVEAAGLSVVLMLTAVPLYWLRFRGAEPA